MSAEKLMVTVTRRFSDGTGGEVSAVGTREQLGPFIAGLLPTAAAIRQGFTFDVKVSEPPREMDA